MSHLDSHLHRDDLALPDVIFDHLAVGRAFTVLLGSEEITSCKCQQKPSFGECGRIKLVLLRSVRWQEILTDLKDA